MRCGTLRRTNHAARNQAGVGSAWSFPTFKTTSDLENRRGCFREHRPDRSRQASKGETRCGLPEHTPAWGRDTAPIPINRASARAPLMGLTGKLVGPFIFEMK